MLREWENEPDEMSDESEEERVALDLITNRPEPQAYADTFGPLRDGAAIGYHLYML